VAGASVFAISGTSASGQILGANDRVRIAVSGVGIRGRQLINRWFGDLPNVEFAYVVDTDGERVEQGKREVIAKTGKTPKGTQDFRVMLEDKDVDAVVITSIDVWHALQTIWACQAGKDVFVEKPCSQRLFEGRRCVEAAEKYGRVVQHGTQRRGDLDWARVAAAVQSEKYGKLVAAKVYTNRPRNSLGFKPIQDPPAHINWSQWLGPAPLMDYHGNLHPYNWHWFWDLGNGEIMNNGVHFFDLCLWAMNKTHPNSVISFGARFVEDPANNYKDQGETPTLQFALYDFGGIPVVAEVCNVAGPRERWTGSERRWNPIETVVFYTENGIIDGREGTFTPNGGEPERIIEFEFDRPAEGGIFANFIDAVRNRNSVPLMAPILDGHYSSAVPHWAIAAYRTGKRETLETCREKMGDNAILQESIDKVAENIRDIFQDDVKLEDIPFQISEKLTIDTEREQFVNSPEADQFLTRVPREPFAIPEQV